MDPEEDEIEIIQPGSTFGMSEQLLGLDLFECTLLSFDLSCIIGQDFRSSFMTSSYCHLIYVDTLAYLKEALHNR